MSENKIACCFSKQQYSFAWCHLNKNIQKWNWTNIMHIISPASMLAVSSIRQRAWDTRIKTYLVFLHKAISGIRRSAAFIPNWKMLFSLQHNSNYDVTTKNWTLHKLSSFQWSAPGNCNSLILVSGLIVLRKSSISGTYYQFYLAQ